MYIFVKNIYLNTYILNYLFQNYIFKNIYFNVSHSNHLFQYPKYMFVITEIEDIIEIKAAAKDKKEAVEFELKKKYKNKIVNDLGVAIDIYKILNIKSYEIRSNILVATVVFEILFYRFYADEVVAGKIISQDEDGIIAEDTNNPSGGGVFNKYEIFSADLFENCGFCRDTGRWVWNYKGNELVFYNGAKIRFRIKKYIDEEVAVSAYMNEQGLGLCEWWD